MQSSNPLIVLGVAVIAAGALGVSPVAAEPRARQQTPQASSAAGQPASTQPPTNPQPTPNWQSLQTLQKKQVLKAQRQPEDRLDQLQRELQIRQQLEQSQPDLNRQLAPSSNQLQIEQEVQQQIDLQNLQNSGENSGTSPALDRLQHEQRIRQRLRPHNPSSEPQALASEAGSSPSDASTSTLAQLRPNKPSDKNQLGGTPAHVAADPASVEVTAVEVIENSEVAETPETSQTENTEVTPQAQVAQLEAVPESEQPDAVSESAQPEVAQPEVEQLDPVQAGEPAKPDQSDTSTEATEPADSQRVEFSDSETSDGATAQSADPSPSDPSVTPPALRDAPIERQNPERQNSLGSLFGADDEPAPEYLYPDPNPLSFPTTPEEVEIVGTQPITLKQAIELALRNNAELRQAQFRLEQQQAQLRETQASNFPTASASANFNQQGSESAQREPDTNALGIANPNAGDIVVQYGDATRLGAGVSLDYTIYTSGRRPALIEAAQGEVRRQQLDIERQTEELILDTANNYYDLQDAGAQVNIFRATLAQAEQSLRDAQALERAGVGTRFDVLQAEVEVANTRQSLTQQLSQLEIARRLLAQQVNLSESLDISAADTIEVSGVWELGLEESIVQAYKNRVELEQALVQREVAQQGRRAALAQLGPQVSFNGDFNVVNDFDNDFTFLHNYSLGLTVSQSLYDGGVARSQANQQESNISIAEAEFERLREQIRFEVERAYSQLDANFSNIQTTALGVERAAEALRLARLRFQAGVGTQTDVLRQQTELARAQVNSLQAIIGYNRAITALQRAISNFPEGYLNEVP